LICLRNQNHKKTETICADCLKAIDNPPTEPDLNLVSPELRALFSQLTLQNRDLADCWKSSYTFLTIEKKRIRVENVLYGFYKADIGNYKLKRICGTINCINPAHHRSRFESTDIFKSVRIGFNRKTTPMDELSDAQWLQQS
jgi:hypothetical protein